MDEVDEVDEGWRTTRLAGVAAIGVGVANLVAELGVYGGVIVPRLPEVARVPLWWWAAMYLPVLVACIQVGRSIRSWTDVIFASVAAGVITALEKYLLAIAGAPGTGTSVASEDPFGFWTTHLMRMTFGYVLLFVSVWFVCARLRTRGARQG